MPYDDKLDEVIQVETVPSDRLAEVIELKVSSYDGGLPKCQITRVLTGIDKHVKLGRLSKAEMVRVRDCMTKLLEMQVEDGDDGNEKKAPAPENLDGFSLDKGRQSS